MLKSWKSLLLVVVLVAAGAAGIKLFKDETSASLLEVLESNGSRLLGTRVDIESAEIEWDAGAFSILKLEIANPGGFSDSNLAMVESIHGEGDLVSGVVDRLVFDGVDVLIEFRGADSNFEVVGERIAKSTGEGAAKSDEGGGNRDDESDDAGDESDEGSRESESDFPDEWRVESVVFQNTRVSVRADWTSETVTFEAPRLTLRALEGEADYVTRSVLTEFLGNVLVSAAGQVDNERMRENLMDRAQKMEKRIRESNAEERGRENGEGDAGGD